LDANSAHPITSEETYVTAQLAVVALICQGFTQFPSTTNALWMTTQQHEHDCFGFSGTAPGFLDTLLASFFISVTDLQTTKQAYTVKFLHFVLVLALPSLLHAITSDNLNVSVLFFHRKLLAKTMEHSCHGIVFQHNTLGSHAQ
jgi:hypothetical protein